MTFDENMVLETTIASRDPNGKTLQARLGDFPPNAVEKFLRYGFQRVFNDAVGGSDTAIDQKVAEATAMIDRFKQGQVGRTVKQGVDAVTKLARAKIAAALKATSPDAYKRLKAKTPDEIAAKLDEMLALESNAHFTESAAKEIKARANTVVKISLDGVDLS